MIKIYRFNCDFHLTLNTFASCQQFKGNSPICGQFVPLCQLLIEALLLNEQIAHRPDYFPLTVTTNLQTAEQKFEPSKSSFHNHFVTWTSQVYPSITASNLYKYYIPQG